MVYRIAEVIREINAQGTAVLLVEQNAGMALSLAETAHVLEVGEVRLSGPADELARTDAVRRLYLGETTEATETAEATETTESAETTGTTEGQGAA